MELNGFLSKKSFYYENAFFATCDDKRIGKQIVHYELYKKIINLPGDIVECGIFKGNSFFEFAHYRNILEHQSSRKIIGFDIFDDFPETAYEPDKQKRENFINTADSKSIEYDELTKILFYKNIENYKLIKGDICKTIPEFIKNNSEIKIALLHIDVDVYEPTVTILNEMYDMVVRGGVIMFDDYGTFPGETKAVDEFIKDKNIQLKKLPFLYKPTYIVKE
ncbi:dTDP-6-deoxy-L-hexose 3-O-methyltransferase [Campylobacter jejuni]|nr:dTDP-6-deoxy-L-hexose 3-O-methyltransferase [Campylobacter jejuni]ECZ6120524.1 dTDP-6-deoxy-L-hexose 3-O-methyltransferase [Campylobacter jejuni]EHD9158769.1 dTDP-6-deoxy-L-hexose 3-O-methyltransferase [Campylobacter jejuni]